MRKNLLLFLTVIISINCFSQISYEKGYYIDNFDQKVNCLIKNMDWKNNPTYFEYKISVNTETKKANIKSIKEFAIFNVSKYNRSTIKIDRSSENLNLLSNSKVPIFEEEQLFLKVLVEGKANLYQYEEGNLKRYFYNKENSNVEQLVFKSYRTSDNNKGQNNRFKQQIWHNLKCSSIEMNSIEKLEYKKNSLINIFTKYNSCNNSDFTNYDKNRERDLFNLSVRPHFKNSSLEIQNASSNSRDIDFENKIGIGFGIEAEFILPFNKNKWAILIEPTLQNFKSEKTTNSSNVSGGKLITEVDYNSIEIPIGLRHYFFINNKSSKIFTNISYLIDVSPNSLIEFKRADNSSLNSMEIETGNNWAIGIGYKLYDKYSLEIRYQTSRNVLMNYNSWSSDYNTLSIIFGYSIF